MDNYGSDKKMRHEARQARYKELMDTKTKDQMIAFAKRYHPTLKLDDKMKKEDVALKIVDKEISFPYAEDAPDLAKKKVKNAELTTEQVNDPKKPEDNGDDEPPAAVPDEGDEGSKEE